MNVTIICIGKLKEKFYTDAVSEYSKRIKRFASLNIIELPDESIPQNSSEKQNEKIKQREGERILAKLKPSSFVVSMCIEGSAVSSEELAGTLKKAAMYPGNIVFVIGGSLGLSDEVKRRSDMRMSFGRITLPHQLMRVVLAEQIYRAFMINSGASYHK